MDHYKLVAFGREPSEFRSTPYPIEDEAINAYANKCLKRHYAYVQSITGKSKTTQRAEIEEICRTVGSLPKHYYMFEWYLPEMRAQAGDYLQRFHLKGVLYRAMSIKLREAGPTVTNKYRFALHMQAHVLPTPQQLALACKGQTKTDIPVEADFIVKPVGGKGGRALERFERTPDGRFRRATTDEVYSYEEVSDHYAALSAQENESYLFQSRVTNHRDLLPISGAAAATCRIVTILDEQGKPEPVVAVYRMGGSMTGVVDNSHQGGVAAPVDIITGQLGLASYLGQTGDLRFFSKHPSSRAQVAGRFIPLWPQVRELAVRAHEAFKPRTLIGWDICITDNGPVIIEGNSAPCTDIIQRRHRKALGSGRFGELLYHHLKDMPREGYDIARMLTIHGRVQRVGFRRWAYETAVELGLSGWVRNEGNYVECCVRGPSRAVVEFAERAWSGPERASVRSVRVKRTNETVAPGFKLDISPARHRPTI